MGVGLLRCMRSLGTYGHNRTVLHSFAILLPVHRPRPLTFFESGWALAMGRCMRSLGTYGHNWTVLHSFAILLPIYMPRPLNFLNYDRRWPWADV